MSSSIQVVSYNVNGIRAAIRKGWTDWVLENNFDVIGLQEVKAMEEQVELDTLREAGYEIYWHAAEKKGYSGVAIFTKLPLKRSQKVWAILLLIVKAVLSV